MTVPATAAGGGTALVRTALGCGVLSVGGLVAVAALGDSAAVPGLGPATLLPPWDLGATPSSALVSVLLAVAWTLGAGAVLCGLVALRRNGFVGWSPRSTALLAVAAVGVLVVVPPLGSADHLSYAAYGRIAVQGGDPYLVPPAQWRGGSDPVAGAVQPPWEQTPSVYGPVATAAQALSAAVGDGSLRRTVWAWQLLCGLAFLATGLALDRIAAGSRAGAAGTAARARVAVVWTLNPLLLGQLVLGAHVDVLAAAAAAGAVAVAARRPLVAGALLGAAAATKAPFALAGVALLWGVRRLPRRAAWRSVALGALGAGLVLVPAHVWSGPATYDQLSQAARFVSFATPWRLLVDVLDPVYGRPAVRDVVGPAAVVLAVAFGALLARRVAALAPPAPPPAPHPSQPSSGGQGALPGENSAPSTPEDATGRAMTADAVRAFALTSLAWVLTVPYALPWYDALAWLPLALLAASSVLDLAMLGRLWVLALAYVPGRVVGMSPDVEELTLGFRRQVAPWWTLAMLVAVSWWAARAGSPGRSSPAGSPRRGAPAP